MTSVYFFFAITGMPFYREILFACHVNQNFPLFKFRKFSRGEISWEIYPHKKNNTLFVYEDSFYKLFEGDVIYYWTRVILKDRRWFFKMDQNHTITKEDFDFHTGLENSLAL